MQIQIQTGSVNDRKRCRRQHVLTEEKLGLDEINISRMLISIQDSTTAHTVHASMELHCIFDRRIISKNLWPPRSLNLTPCDFYLCGTLKNKVYTDN